jgi:histidinol-phosphatase (PHP family)
MLDYHVHLWPHPQLADETDLTIERLARYCDAARAAGVEEIALTEHFHRFEKAREVVEGWWANEPNEELRSYVAEYFDHHATADLDLYMSTLTAAKDSGLPIVAGLEVDYYPGLMDKVAALLDGYPFDVLLGSIHWLGTWMYDIVDSPIQMAEWDARGIDATWKRYAEAIEELAGTATCDVLAHPDLVKVTGRIADRGVVVEVEERICDAAVNSAMAAELSSAGFRKPTGEAYPSMSLLRRFHRGGVPLTTASDTHGPGHIADRAPVLHRLAREAGYSTLRAFEGRNGYDVALGDQPAVDPTTGPGSLQDDPADSKSIE